MKTGTLKQFKNVKENINIMQRKFKIFKKNKMEIV